MVLAEVSDVEGGVVGVWYRTRTRRVRWGDAVVLEEVVTNEGVL